MLNALRNNTVKFWFTDNTDAVTGKIVDADEKWVRVLKERSGKTIFIYQANIQYFEVVQN